MPPATDTDFFNKAGAMNTVAQEEARKTDPADVAKVGYDALMKGKDRVIAGFSTKVQAAAFRLLPDSMVSEADRENTTALWIGAGVAAFVALGLVAALTYRNVSGRSTRYPTATKRAGRSGKPKKHSTP